MEDNIVRLDYRWEDAQKLEKNKQAFSQTLDQVDIIRTALNKIDVIQRFGPQDVQ